MKLTFLKKVALRHELAKSLHIPPHKIPLKKLPDTLEEWEIFVTNSEKVIRLWQNG